MILEDSSERRMCCVDGVSYYSDVPLGLYVVRGDSIVLMGELMQDDSRTKRVTLEELEEHKKTAEEALEWDFDTDLVA